MKRILMLLCAVTLIFGMVGVGNATLINAGFETGDFTGWLETVPIGGFAAVVTSHETTEPGGILTFYPVEGDYFALLKTDGPGSFTTLSQTVYLPADSRLAGWAAFEDNDQGGIYNDSASVTIYDAGTDALLDVPWYQSSNMVNGPGALPENYGQTPWEYWSWAPPAAGNYRVELGIANMSDSENDSYALFDAVHTPEPATLLLMGSGLLGVAGIGRKRFMRR